MVADIEATLCTRYRLAEIETMRVDHALTRYDACRRAEAAALADGLWVARVAQAEGKDFKQALDALNRSAGRGE